MAKELFLYMEDDGKCKNKEQLVNFIRSHSKGKHIIKSQPYSKRTLPQNAYLHACMLPIVQQALYEGGWSNIKTIENAKDFIKVKFLMYEEVNQVTGEVQQFFRNTSELTKEQFSMLIEEVAVWLWDFFNVTLPMPNQQVEMFEAY